MSAVHAEPPITWDEFLALPDDPEYRHAELIDGELVLVNPPAFIHQIVIARLMFAIMSWTSAASGRGVVIMEPPVQISRLRGYLPDLAWYRDGRDRPIPGQPYLAGAPDIAIEVLSPSTRRFDTVRKSADYAKVGVSELWLIDPDGPSAMIMRLPQDQPRPVEYVLAEELKPDERITTPLMPGLSILLADLTAG